jgi:hypothetical protein
MNELSLAELWEGGAEYRHAVAEVRSGRLERLRSLGVNVNDPAALERAYDDRNLMARLAGQEMRVLMALVAKPAGGSDFEGKGLANRISTARTRGLAEDGRPRDLLL